MNQISIAHVVGGLNRGGAETWLVEMTKKLNPRLFRTTFIVHSDAQYDYLDEIRDLGANVLVCPLSRNPLAYFQTLTNLLQTSDSFDIVHSHMQRFNFLPLAAAKHAAVPVRISHSHIDDSNDLQSGSFTRRLYCLASQTILKHVSNRGIAASEPAAAALFGARWRDDNRFSILYCSIDSARFTGRRKNNALRAQLGISSEDLVVCAVGRLERQKNHMFLVEIIAELVKQRPEVRLLLVGEGSERDAILSRAASLGIADRISMAGSCSNVPQLLEQAADVFAMPSIREGLPLALLEAQAAGLPCIVSTSITNEAIFIETAVVQVPLSAGAIAWANTINDLLDKPESHNGMYGLANSKFCSIVGAKALERLYISEFQNATALGSKL